MPDQISRGVAIFETLQSLRRISKALQNYSHEGSNPDGVIGPQLWVLKTVFKNGSLPLGELSQEMY
jgi:hypothetical protein